MPEIDGSDLVNSPSVGSPKLVGSDYSLHKHRSSLIYIVLLPYIGLCIVLLGMVLFTTLAEERITLGASIVLSPLGALAGGIVGYYFKSPS